MEEETTTFYKIINELCSEKGIEQELLSFNWIRQLKKDGKIRNLIRYQFDLNSANAFRIAGDKYATYELLHKNNIPIIEHRMVFNPETREDYFESSQIDNAIDLLKKGKVIIKANQSAKGKHVILCETENEIREAIDVLLKQNKDTLSACPYVEFEYEYRAVYLFGEILYIYKKEKPYIIGDGIRNIKQLISEKFGNDINFEIAKKIDFNKIPNKDEKVIISWKHNLCNGAKPIIVDENDVYYNQIKNIAILAGKTIDINFATIDVALTNKKELMVVEINASVCMDKFAEQAENGYSIAKNIYSRAIDKMFEN